MPVAVSGPYWEVRVASRCHAEHPPVAWAVTLYGPLSCWGLRVAPLPLQETTVRFSVIVAGSLPQP
jgi:hypothetical protein